MRGLVYRHCRHEGFADTGDAKNNRIAGFVFVAFRGFLFRLPGVPRAAFRPAKKTEKATGMHFEGEQSLLAGLIVSFGLLG